MRSKKKKKRERGRRPNLKNPESSSVDPPPSATTPFQTLHAVSTSTDLSSSSLTRLRSYWSAITGNTIASIECLETPPCSDRDNQRSSLPSSMKTSVHSISPSPVEKEITDWEICCAVGEIRKNGKEIVRTRCAFLDHPSLFWNTFFHWCLDIEVIGWAYGPFHLFC